VRRGAAAALTVGLLVACAGDNPTVEGTPSAGLPRETIGGVEVAVHGTVRVTHRSTGVEAQDNLFTPTILRGAPGARVLVLLRNGGRVTHNFTLEGTGVGRDVDPGDLREATVTFPASGSLVFFCRFHRDSSAMIGAFQADPSVPTPR
jgi:plastocyanin